MESQSGSGGPQAVPSGSLPTRRLTREDFARLYQEHWGALWCVAAGVLSDRNLAQDAVQQAAIVGLQRLESFEPGTSFLAWMGTIVKNSALNDARKRQRRRSSGEDPDLMHAKISPVPALISLAIDGFDRQLLEALEKLDETARSCLLMRIVAELPYKQIGLALGIPEGTAASHVHRARASLRSEMLEVNIPSRTAASSSRSALEPKGGGV